MTARSRAIGYGQRTLSETRQPKRGRGHSLATGRRAARDRRRQMSMIRSTSISRVAACAVARAAPRGRRAGGGRRADRPRSRCAGHGHRRGDSGRRLREQRGHRRVQGDSFRCAPVGDLRWRPPEPVTGWEGVRDASESGAICVRTAARASPRTRTACSSTSGRRARPASRARCCSGFTAAAIRAAPDRRPSTTARRSPRTGRWWSPSTTA